MSFSDSSTPSFEMASHLDIMDSQRFDPSQKTKITLKLPLPATLLQTVSISSAREGILEETDAQRFDTSLKKGIFFSQQQLSWLRTTRSRAPERSTTWSPLMPKDLTCPKKSKLRPSERSCKFAELWKALGPRDTCSLPFNPKLFPGGNEGPSELFSGSNNARLPLARADTAASLTTINDDNTEVRITDHILRFGGTTTRTIIRPVPSSSSLGSCVSLPGTGKFKSPFSRPGSPVPVPSLSSLNCFASDAFENEVNRVCEEREKKAAGEGEIKVFVKEQINLTREARFKAPLEEIDLNERPVAQC